MADLIEDSWLSLKPSGPYPVFEIISGKSGRTKLSSPYQSVTNPSLLMCVWVSCVCVCVSCVCINLMTIKSLFVFHISHENKQGFEAKRAHH